MEVCFMENKPKNRNLEANFTLTHRSLESALAVETRFNGAESKYGTISKGKFWMVD
jgi:hypothetical protein